jgi:hypothetical protein
MHREIKDELLFAMLFLGFLRFPASLPPDNMTLPSPNAGADPIESAALALPVTDVPPSLLPGTSVELRPSLGCSCMLEWTPDRTLLFVSILYNGGGGFARELRDSRQTFVPAVAG